jgi:hypothetical protein
MPRSTLGRRLLAGLQIKLLLSMLSFPILPQLLGITRGTIATVRRRTVFPCCTVLTHVAFRSLLDVRQRHACLWWPNVVHRSKRLSIFPSIEHPVSRVHLRLFVKHVHYGQ